MQARYGRSDRPGVCRMQKILTCLLIHSRMVRAISMLRWVSDREVCNLEWRTTARRLILESPSTYELGPLITCGHGARQASRLTRKVISRLSFSSNTVILTCFPSSKHVMPTYSDTLSMRRSTPSARITSRLSRLFQIQRLSCHPPNLAPCPSLCRTFNLSIPTPLSLHPPSGSITYSFVRD